MTKVDEGTAKVTSPGRQVLVYMPARLTIEETGEVTRVLAGISLAGYLKLAK